MPRLLAVAFPCIALAARASGDAGREFYAVHSQLLETSEALTVYACNPDPTRTASVVVEIETGPIATTPVGPLACAPVHASNARQVAGSVVGQLGYRVRSDLPVFVQQHMPFSTLLPMTASALLPDRAIFGTEYLVLTIRGQQTGYSSVLTVVAPEPARVTVEVTAATTAGPGVPALAAGQSFVADLPALGVLQIAGADDQDLSGSRVTASGPVEVFAGCHRCLVPGSTADYVQETMIPLPMWGNEAIAPASTVPTGGINLWRILAAEDGTTVTTDPPLPGTPRILARAEWFELSSAADFAISATGPILAVRIEDSDRAYGDPSLLMLLPRASFTPGGMFTLPDNSGPTLTQWVDIVALPGTNVIVDGLPVAAASFVPVGASGFGHASITLPIQKTHTVSADQPIAAYAGAIAGGLGIAYPVDLRCGRAAPSEISRLREPLWLARRGSDVLFSWEDSPLATAYNVYRGTIRSIWSHSGLHCAVAPTQLLGTRREATLAVPSNGYFLVTAANCAGEGESGGDPARSDCPP